jgi:hypothetical protein
MVDPVGEQAERQLRAEERQDVEERHGIGTAAHRDQDRLPPGDQAVLSDRGARERDQRGRV